MKKSFDYFKTLKDMSGCIGKAYAYADKPDLYKKETLVFHSIKRELSARLSEEFVAPVDRNDIYNLSSFLSRELSALDYMSHLMFNTASYQSDNDVSAFLKYQSDALARLSDKKGYTCLLNEIHSFNSELNAKRRRMWTDAKDSLFKGNNMLLKYVYFDKSLRFIERVSDTFSEIGRVIINNL